ncbi:AzlC family ABC transporter permease [Maribrevibacterium harenarium]|uniref:AzlC family ABC transporter permease n=1 Tax=Maribrevibacterium harenarium TaxID=2589817 RepID=A0A501X5L3_9GAMM|nr:AzlC family ABC transporter permease [Maribrevibacterium harenarium]TPE55687.1 AzlC family ABC transporter permease [Maribrevibacterium harenarium]
MNAYKNAQRGAFASIPMIIGGVPFGLLFGSLAAANDLSIWFAIAMSSIVFAGSAQFVALGLIAADAPLWVIILTTFVVNLRHILYAADMLRFVRHLPLRLRLLMGFGLIDETYAAVRPMYDMGSANKADGHQVYIGSFLSFYLMWNVTTVLGALAGELIPGISDWGLEFAMVATFIGIVTPYLKSVPYWGAFGVAIIASVTLKEMPNHLGLILATLLAVLVGYCLDRYSEVDKKRGAANV